MELLLVGGLLYFIPTIIAVFNKPKYTTVIFVLNLLLGWTFVGWVVALIWALMPIKEG